MTHTFTSWDIERADGTVTLSAPAHQVHLCRWRGSLGYQVDGEVRALALAGTRPAAGETPTALLAGDQKGMSLGVALEGDRPTLNGQIRNRSHGDIVLQALVLTIDEVRLGSRQGNPAFFRNGYQSWTETRTFTSGQVEMVPLLHPFSVLQDNPRNLSSQHPGDYVSDMYAVLGVAGGPQLLIGQGKPCRQFFYVRVHGLAGQDRRPQLDLVYDFGGQVLGPGREIDLDPVYLLCDDDPNRLQDGYFDNLAVPEATGRPLPTGWCSWYYYYTKTRPADLRENLAALAARPTGLQTFLLDDGYQTAVGDWLSLNAKFSSGLKEIAAEIRAAGLVPGLWLAPFVARRNACIYHDHPEWFLRDRSGRFGRPGPAGWNPNWGLDGLFYGLDTTHPGFQAYLRQVIGTIVGEWGFRYLKLDFVYGAALPGLAYDRTLTAAERVQLGYRIVREVAGDDVFILGCGSPISAAIGLVDAMRIGPDVAPYWTDTFRHRFTRDPHALCTKFAIRSILNRAPMHRRLWLNDPDCLLLRETQTRLDDHERMSLANAIIITGGMCTLSDRLATLPEATWQRLERIIELARVCDRGRAWPLDYLEREIPELVYNSAGYLAVFNFADQPMHKRLPLAETLGRLEGLADGLVAPATPALSAGSARAPAAAGRSQRRPVSPPMTLEDVWTGERFEPESGWLDLGTLPPHASRLLRAARILDAQPLAAAGGKV